MSTLSVPRTAALPLRPPLLWSLAVLAVAAVLYVGLWFTTAHVLLTQAENWIADQRAAGMSVGYGAVRRSGFPGRVVVSFGDWDVSAPVTQNGWSWHADAVRLTAAPWAPADFSVDLAGHHRIAGLWTPLSMTAEVSADEARLRPVLTRRGALAEVSVALRNLTVRPGIGAPEALTMDSATFDLAGVSDAKAPTWRLQLTAENWRAAQLDGVPAFAPAIKTLRVTADLVGSLEPGPLPTALEAWRRGGGTLEVREASLNWPPLWVSVDGTWALDARLQPVGAMTARIRGFYAAVDALAQEGRIRGDEADNARTVLGLLSYRPQGADEPELKIAVTVQDNKLYFGPLELMDVPRVQWPDVTALR